MMTEADRWGREAVVPLRLNSSAVSFAGLFAFLGAFSLLTLFIVFPSPSPPVYSRLLLLFAIISLCPVPVCVFYRCHARLIVSDTGLRWRTWGEWKRAAWDGVRDYYDHPPSSEGSDGDLMTIETQTGNITLNRRWRESDGVRWMVQEQARQAEIAEWGVQGQRASGSDSRTFSYSQKSFWSMVVIAVGLFLPYTVFGWNWLLHPEAGSLWKLLISGWTPGDFWGSLFGTGFILVLTVSMIFMINGPLLILISCLPGMLDVHRRRAEKITTRQGGITFDDGRRPITASWDEVTGYILQPSVQSQSPLLRGTALSSSPILPWRWVYVVETKQGGFGYSAFIGGSEALGQIIKERAMPLVGRDLTSK